MYGKSFQKFIRIGVWFIISIIIVTCIFSVCGCNRQVFDFNLKFEKALIKWPDGTMKTVSISKWRDYEGEQIQIISKDGTVYLVNSINTILVHEDN